MEIILGQARRRWSEDERCSKTARTSAFDASSRTASRMKGEFAICSQRRWASREIAISGSFVIEGDCAGAPARSRPLFYVRVGSSLRRARDEHKFSTMLLVGAKVSRAGNYAPRQFQTQNGIRSERVC